MKIDVIISHPRNNDYPIWRDMMREYRYKFNKVIVVFTETNDDLDFSSFVIEAMKNDDVTFLFSPKVVRDEDWRNIAVNHGLNHSNAEWVWFMEQDFFVKNGFWRFIDVSMKKNNAIATYQQTRLHPCSIFITRELLNRTRLNFGIVAGKLDHFGLIQKDLEKLTSPLIIPEHLYRHLNGLSHNFTLIKNGDTPNYEKRTFNLYLNQCLDADVPLSSKWVEIVLSYFDRK